MKARGFAKLFVAAITLLVFCAPRTAQTTSSTLSVSSNLIVFGDHDIGTTTLPKHWSRRMGAMGPWTFRSRY